jgi:hypothetical protein
MGEKREEIWSRKWPINIQNPKEHGYMTHDDIKKCLNLFKGLIYWCMADEIGKEGTYHIHLYFVLENVVRFSTVRDRFPHWHLPDTDKRGTSQENRDYIRKEGKWAGTDKEETRVDGTFEEWGEMPVEKQGKRTDWTKLYDMIEQGMSDYEIIKAEPKYLLRIEKIAMARRVLLSRDFDSKRRDDLRVVYVWGRTGTGKTTYVCDLFGYKNICRVTNYSHPFDSYRGQDVIIFEEFRSSLKCEEMLNYLDKHPCELEARYFMRQACYTKVFIISNLSLQEQYVGLQNGTVGQRETWNAFIRRIHDVWEFKGFEDYEVYKPQDCLNKVRFVKTDDEELPKEWQTSIN